VKTFTVIYELDGLILETTVEHWTKEAAREKFAEENPGAVLQAIYED
jgi:hypothetical protein